MKLKKSDLSRYIESGKEGYVADLTSIRSRNTSYLGNTLRSYFREQIPKYTGIFLDEDGEEVLSELNRFIKDRNMDKAKLEFPVSSGFNLYLVPVRENIDLVVKVCDEYYGEGDYVKYVGVESIIFNDNTTVKDLGGLIKMVKGLLAKLG
ncbi:hypothetical protein [Bacillus sp. 1006-3]|uniref:hypothetical protein n=1 Tax=Bacillus sp. 1006-3 TaxID=2922309 RepID=UPI001F0EFCF5|nr:hypothetical protein [Bacillus sp. 1006-3]MCH4866825.1 hypothetical protein [Bacillus sp. 1006-3]